MDLWPFQTGWHVPFVSLTGWLDCKVQCLEIVWAKYLRYIFFTYLALNYFTRHLLMSSLVLCWWRWFTCTSWHFIYFLFVFEQAFLGGLVLLSELLPIPLPIRSLEVCEYFKTLPSLQLLSETLRYFLGDYENVADFNLHWHLDTKEREAMITDGGWGNTAGKIERCYRRGTFWRENTAACNQCVMCNDFPASWLAVLRICSFALRQNAT